jgi:hypothetical protein
MNSIDRQFPKKYLSFIDIGAVYEFFIFLALFDWELSVS